jgi:hypothetical protein
MIAVEIKKYINLYLKPFFEDNGYDIFWTPPDAFRIQKKVNGIFIFFSYNKQIRARGSSFMGSSPRLTFDDIEKIINPIEKKYNFRVSDVTFGDMNTSEILRLRRVAISEIIVANEGDFSLFASEVKKYVSEVIYPFVEKYNSIESLYEFINATDVKEAIKYFGGLFPFDYFKAMYIAYIFNNTHKYNLIKNHVFESIENCKNEAFYIELYPKYVAAFNEFVEELESGRSEKLK